MTSRLLLCYSVLLLAGSSVRGAEIATNRAGGGAWSDAATWRGNKVPGANDDVVIQKNDIVVFDRNDDGKVTCQKLLIDPKGALVFKNNAGKIVCSVADVVETLGVIRLDGTKNASDHLELRMLGKTAEKRQIKLLKGSGLLLYGRPNLAGDGRNVAVTSPKVGDQKDEISGLIEAGAVSMLDLQRAFIHNVKLQATGIDNTGAKPNERLNVTDTRFLGLSRLFFSGCDTPVISRNTFDASKTPLPSDNAIWVAGPLVEIKDNFIRGYFANGITVYGGDDPVISGNIVEKCGNGIHCYASTNAMIKKCTVRECSLGVYVYTMSGVLEDLVLEKNQTALHNLSATIQLTTVHVKDLPKDGKAITARGGSTTILNCNIVPAQVKVELEAPPAGKPMPVPMTAFQYLIAGVKGAPAGSVLEVHTATPPLPANVADVNVRNSPAPLVGGMTPLPRSLAPLVVKSWMIDTTGKLVPSPEYSVQVLGVAAKEGAARPLLKSQTFRPAESAFRAMPNDPTPTLEVSLK
jgi:parallel beta-helix repeat protein